MIASVFLRVHVTPKCYRPRRRHRPRRPCSLPSRKAFERRIALRAAQRAAIRCRYPLVISRWCVPANQKPTILDDTSDKSTSDQSTPWTEESMCRFWQWGGFHLFRACEPRPYFAYQSEHRVQPTIALVPKLEGIPLETIKRHYKIVLQKVFWPVVETFSVACPRNVVPKEWEVVMDSFMLVTGVTHYLCYTTPASLARDSLVRVAPREVSIVPVDALLLTLYCANLPPIPPSHPKVTLIRQETVPCGPDDCGPDDATTTVDFSVMRLPTLFLTVPDPSTMPLLLQCFVASFDQIVHNLFPPPPSPCGPLPPEPKIWAAQVAPMCSPTYVAEKLRFCRGMELNMMALGVSDKYLWKALHFSRDILYQNMIHVILHIDHQSK